LKNVIRQNQNALFLALIAHLTPLASFNCTGMAFRGGYFLLQLLLRCALRYTMAHWSWHILLTFMQLVCSTVMAVNIIMS